MEAATGERTAFILFTDIYRSTQLWEKFPREFGQSLEQHNSLVEETVLAHGGEIMKNLGDGYIAIFNTPDECVRSGVEVQRKLKDMPPLPDGSEILVRVVGHGGPLQPLAAGRGYFGRPLNRASRICQVCHPGQMLVSGEVALALRGLPEEVQLFNLGRHHLRDLAEPEELHQVDHPQFPRHQFPPLPTLGFRPNNLVYQPNSFIGREWEMGELKQLVLEGKQRLITITGPGGYGKSRLATQLCANLLEYYENGVFEVLLAPVGDQSRIAGAAADALGFKFYSKAEPEDQLIDYLREKNMLLCFDNFEHVLEGKDLVTEILQHAPKVSILVTSREPLRLKAEKVYRLEPLPVGVRRADQPGREAALVSTAYPCDSEAREELPEAVQLFVDRASLVSQALELTPENLSIIGEICARLDGVPLAVELAAGWADGFTLPEMLDEVSQQLELTARMDDVPKRQHSIRASLDWSYGLLNQEQQKALRAVSAFKGGFFYEAAEAIVGRSGNGGTGVSAVIPSATKHGRDGRATSDSPAPPRRASLQKNLRTILTQLCDKGWMFTREALGKTRFFVRDAATHQYALEKLAESADHEPGVLAHSEYFSGLIRQEGERLDGQGQLEALKTLSMELENIYAGLNTCLRKAGNTTPVAGKVHLPPEAGSELERPLYIYAKHLYPYLDIASRWLEGIPWYERMVGASEKLGSTALRIQAFLGLARLLWPLSRHDEAEKAANAARDLAVKAQDLKSIANAVNSLGIIARNRGRFEEADKLLQESLQAWREIGSRHGVAASLNNLGLVAQALGRYKEAEKLHRESLQVRHENGDRYGIATSLANLGIVMEAQGRYEEAQKLQRESLQIKREIGDRLGAAYSLSNLGVVAWREGRYEEAVKLHQESLQIEREIGDRYGMALSYMNLGCVANDRKRCEEAEELWKESLRIAKEIDNRACVAYSLNNLGEATYAQGRYEEAEGLWNESLQVMYEIGDRAGTAYPLCNLGALSIKLGCFAEAGNYLQEVLSLCSEIGARSLNIQGLLSCGHMFAMTGRFKEAAILHTGAEHQAEEINFTLDPLTQSELEEGKALVRAALSAHELASLTAQSEKMTLEELTEFALKAPEELDLPED